MPFIINAKELSMRDKVVCDSRTQIWISKPYEAGADYIPEFGQEVTCREAATAVDTTMTVRPLVENLPAGRVLTFSGGSTMTLDAPAKAKDTTLSGTISGNVAAFEKASTNGVEQTITVANPVAKGDMFMDISAAAGFIPGYQTIDFGNNITVRTTEEITNKDATRIFLAEPAPVAIAAAATADIAWYRRLLSANSSDDSSNASVLNERNYESGKGTAKAVTSYADLINFSGCSVKYDDAIDLLYELKENSDYVGYAVRCILGINQKGARTVAGEVALGTHSSQRPVDQAQKVQFTLEVDGNLQRVNYPIVANSFGS